MPQLTMTVVDRQGMFGAGMARRLAKLEALEAAARERAAKVATTATRSNFTYRRDAIAPRPGRSSTGGKMKTHLAWRNRNAGVEFDIEAADRRVPHWIIHEIGTGNRATIKQADKPNPSGRPSKGATYVRTVKSQRGRRIRGGLVFASASGQYSPPGARRNEQLHWASSVTGAPVRPAAIRIQREIQGQHFVKKGGERGFREYKQTVLGAARQTFRKSQKP